MNDSMIDDRATTSSKIPDYLNVPDQTQSENKAAFEQNTNTQNDFYSSMLSNSVYQYPQSFYQQSYESGNVLQPQNSIYKNEDNNMLDKRVKIPQTPFEQPDIQTSDFIDPIPKYDMTNNQLRNTAQPVIYFPKIPTSCIYLLL